MTDVLVSCDISIETVDKRRCNDPNYKTKKPSIDNIAPNRFQIKCHFDDAVNTKSFIKCIMDSSCNIEPYTSMAKSLNKYMKETFGMTDEDYSDFDWYYECYNWKADVTDVFPKNINTLIINDSDSDISDSESV